MHCLIEEKAVDENLIGKCKPLHYMGHSTAPSILLMMA